MGKCAYGVVIRIGFPKKNRSRTENQNLDSLTQIFLLLIENVKKKNQKKGVFPLYCHSVSFIIEHDYF